MKTNKFEIYETYNYNIFKFKNGNRIPKDKIIDKLTDSIRKHGLQVPIVLNTENEIVEGQHRFLALKKLNKPVNYLISKAWKDHDDTIEINCTPTKWNALDFANNIAVRGNYDAKEALEIAETWYASTKGKLSKISTLEILMSGPSHFGLTKNLRDNRYTINKIQGYKIFDILNIMSRYESQTSPYAQVVTRSIKKLMNEFDKGLQKPILRKMCNDNYLRTFSKQNDQTDYMRKLYLEAKRKYKGVTLQAN